MNLQKCFRPIATRMQCAYGTYYIQSHRNLIEGKRQARHCAMPIQYCRISSSDHSCGPRKKQAPKQTENTLRHQNLEEQFQNRTFRFLQLACVCVCPRVRVCKVSNLSANTFPPLNQITADRAAAHTQSDLHSLQICWSQAP